jgi:hypothetical protein
VQIHAAQFEDNPNINNLALTEFVLEFARLYNAIIPFIDPVPSRVKFAIGLRNAHFLAIGSSISHPAVWGHSKTRCPSSRTRHHALSGTTN